MADKTNDGFILHVFQTTGAVDERTPGGAEQKRRPVWTLALDEQRELFVGSARIGVASHLPLLLQGRLPKRGRAGCRWRLNCPKRSDGWS